MKFVPAESDKQAKKDGVILFVTRDGIGLQVITLKKNALDQGFAHTQKRASHDMRIQTVVYIGHQMSRLGAVPTDRALHANALASITVPVLCPSTLFT